jgi:hypothetical protein
VGMEGGGRVTPGGLLHLPWASNPASLRLARRRPAGRALPSHNPYLGQKDDVNGASSSSLPPSPSLSG